MIAHGQGRPYNGAIAAPPCTAPREKRVTPILRPALLAALLVATAACGRAGSPDEDATPTPGLAGDVTATDALSGTLAADADGADADGADADADSADAEGTPLPTANATVEALAASFELPEVGASSAPLLIMEFSDYRCPYCKQFFDDTLPQVRAEWIETGKARLQFYDLPLTNHGFPAVIGAEAAHCAGEHGAYWTMHDALFEAFDDLTDKADPQDEASSMAEILAVAEDADVDFDKVKECVESKRYRPIVAELAATALEREIHGTPWFLLLAGDHAESIPGYVDYETMLPILEREYSRALGTPIPTDTAAPPTATPAAPTATPAATD